MDDKEKFIADLYPAARQVSHETGMSSELILAQAAQETGWGQKVLPGTNNIFNIKADGGWHGPSKTFNVPEFENGRTVWKDQSFRVYGTQEEALRDRVAFLRENTRYANAGLFKDGTKGDLRKEAEALQKAGYATDPHYADSLVRVFNGPTMQRAINDAQSLEHSVSRSTLRLGARDEAASILQADLAALGYTDNRGQVLQSDGHYGHNTEAAVRAFQGDHGLLVDGIAGKNTLEAIRGQRQLHNGIPALSPALEGNPHLRIDGFDPVNRAPAARDWRLPGLPDVSAPTLNPYADPRHSDHGLYAELRQRIPNASEERIVECTATCHRAGIKSGELGYIQLRGTEALLFAPNGGPGRSTEVALTSPAPSIQQTMQHVQAFDQQQQMQMTHMHAQQAQAGPVLGGPGGGLRMG